MNLYKLLYDRHIVGKPLRVGLIGAGKFGTMFLSQVRRILGIHLMGVVDLVPERALQNLALAGW